MDSINDIISSLSADDIENLKAAVFAGADAVYLGVQSFNARASATNFDYETLKQAVQFCHARNVNVNVTLNTILYDSELTAFAETVKNVADEAFKNRYNIVAFEVDENNPYLLSENGVLFSLKNSTVVLLKNDGTLPLNAEGKKVYDDKGFVKSLADQYKRRHSLSPRQVMALRRVAVAYKDFIPGYEAKAAELGLTDIPSANEKTAEVINGASD